MRLSISSAFAAPLFTLDDQWQANELVVPCDWVDRLALIVNQRLSYLFRVFGVLRCGEGASPQPIYTTENLENPQIGLEIREKLQNVTNVLGDLV
jgi:hypothetical protein